MNSLQTLKKYFGYDNFRAEQENLITGILKGKDTLGIMPTGAGKSICYQVPALMMEGITIVISPLISLMKDQVDTLVQGGIPAAFVNSTLTERQIDKCLSFAREGKYKIIYVAPERLLTDNFISFGQTTNISMIAIDEAHCISQWGNDFRPSYTRIPSFIKFLQRKPIISAFTATATPQVKDDIINILELANPTISISSFDRPNLFFETKRSTKKFNDLASFLKDKHDQTGIVYCNTRNNVEKVHAKLIEKGFEATYYHGGLSDNERLTNQENFIYDRAKVIVATNAFGMGIDKSNVSYIVHYNMPMNIESYYQEAGRAGRDGTEAHCILLYSNQDIQTSLFLIEQKAETGEETEFLKVLDRKKLQAMDNYSNTKECLRNYILTYFGEEVRENCGNCSNCSTTYEELDITTESKKILSTVHRMKERYGVRLIIDVLTGSKNKKLIDFNLHKLSTYGISNETKERLDEIISFLLEEDYLFKTSDQYPIIKLGKKARDFLFGDEQLIMKTRKASIKEVQKEGQKHAVNRKLLELLKETRLNLAKVKKVPAYVIFHDSTLLDMCIKLPKNIEDLQRVSGVGTVKAERFGEQFLKAIAEFVPSKTTEGPWSKASLSAQVSGQEGIINDISQIEVSKEPTTVKGIADKINCYLIENGYKKISAVKINDWLVKQGFLEIVRDDDGKTHKIPTEKGVKSGITTEDRIYRGENASINLYPEEFQRFIADNTMKILVMR